MMTKNIGNGLRLEEYEDEYKERMSMKIGWGLRWDVGEDWDEKRMRIAMLSGWGWVQREDGDWDDRRMRMSKTRGWGLRWEKDE